MRNVANTNITSSLVLLQNRTSENIAEEYYGGHPKTAAKSHNVQPNTLQPQPHNGNNSSLLITRE